MVDLEKVMPLSNCYQLNFSENCVRAFFKATKDTLEEKFVIHTFFKVIDQFQLSKKKTG